MSQAYGPANDDESLASVRREIEDDVLPAARRLGVDLVPYRPLGRSFLTGTLSAATADGFGAEDLRHGDPRFHGDNARRNQAILAEVHAVATQRRLTPGQLALVWLLAHGGDVAPIPGAKRATRAEENAAAADVDLTLADLHRLHAKAPRDAWAGDRHSYAAHRTTRTPGVPA